ncbi:MAG: hypothetical protein ACE14P_03680 [Methanotrichaceae archaeon]
MKSYSKIALLAVSILLALGTALASEYPFGSKVLPGEIDVGSPLSVFPTIPAVQFPIFIEYWDIGVSPGVYDDSDIVYLHFGLPATPIRANDIRLTPFGDKPAGSKVTPADNDIGQPLLATAPAAVIRWLNLYGGPTFDLKDPLFAQLPGLIPPFSKLNDVRLTDSEGMSAGTKLQDSDPDFGKFYTPPPIPILGGLAGTIFFFDANGNRQYDYPDDIYFRVNFVPPGPLVVSINDVRLSGPSCLGC